MCGERAGGEKWVLRYSCILNLFENDMVFLNLIFKKTGIQYFVGG